jgi:hypothetical protein
MRHNTQSNPQPWYNSGADGGARTHNLRFRRTYPPFAARCITPKSALQCGYLNARSSASQHLTAGQRLTAQPTNGGVL